MARSDPIAEIIQYNRRFVGAYSIVLRQKLQRLASNPFVFFRGTFHLFARDLVARVLEPWEGDNPFAASASRLVGDIHSENYGTFKAADGTVHYDVNDFDETTVGSFDFDCKRAATSLFLLAAATDLSLGQATTFVETFVRTYVHSVAEFFTTGSANTFGYSEHQLPELRAARDLINSAAQQSRHDYVVALTETAGKSRRFKLDGKKLFALTAADRGLAERLVADYVARLGPAAQTPASFYHICDVAGRIAGVGSLGRLRVAVLLNGHGSGEAKNVLLELKQALPSGYDEARQTVGQAKPESRAAEVIATERLMQSASNRLLGYAIDGSQSFQVRELGPRDQRLEISSIRGEKNFAMLADLYAKLLAKCHLRADISAAGERPGTVIASALAGREAVFIKRVTAFALAYSELVEDDHRQYCARQSEVARAWHVE